MLCGAIITAGALIGLGLTALGYGLTGGPAFGPETINPNTNTLWGSSSLMVILIVLLITLLIGLGNRLPRPGLPPLSAYDEHLREMGRHDDSHVPS